MRPLAPEVVSAIRLASRKLFGTAPAGNNVRSGRKALRQPSRARYMAEYYPKTVQWMKFKHYVWADYEFLLADRKERARLGTSKRTRGDGKSKRGLQ